MLAMVSTQLPEEFITLIQAHIYMVCPTAIPALPKPLPGSSEVELMDSLGMIQDKHGTYESFDRFLTRTEVRKYTSFSKPIFVCLCACVCVSERESERVLHRI